MDSVCDYIKDVCDNTYNSQSNGSEYIEFKACEEEDWTNDQLASYISSKLQTLLGDDVENIQYTDIDDNVIVSFSYKGFIGEVSETYNSRNYHFWVVYI